MKPVIEPSAKAKLLAEGIATGEGYYDKEGDPLPRRIHNPGDLEIGDRGYGTQGGKTCFPDDQTGWGWLYGETTLMLASMQTRHRSKIYKLTDTFLEVAVHYTGGDNSVGWAETVSKVCHMTPQNTLQDFLNA